MGRRTEQDLAALRAQAIVSRTVALRRAGQWRTRGYDLVATVADQAYAGIGFERRSRIGRFRRPPARSSPSTAD
jgi:peptidoglycan hydrolase-like amidase